MIANERLATCMMCHEPCIAACPVTQATHRHTTAPSRLAQAAFEAPHGRIAWQSIADTLYYCIHCNRCTAACVYAEEPIYPGRMLLHLRQEMREEVAHPIAEAAERTAMPPPELPSGSSQMLLVLADRWAPAAESNVEAAISVLSPARAVGYLVDLGWNLALSGGRVHQHLGMVVERLNAWPGTVVAAFPRDVVWLNQIAAEFGVRFNRPVEYFATALDPAAIRHAPREALRAYHPSAYLTHDLGTAEDIAACIQAGGAMRWWKPGVVSPGPAPGISQAALRAMSLSFWGDLSGEDFDAVITDDPYIAQALAEIARPDQRIWLVPEWLAYCEKGETVGA